MKVIYTVLGHSKLLLLSAASVDVLSQEQPSSSSQPVCAQGVGDSLRLFSHNCLTCSAQLGSRAVGCSSSWGNSSQPTYSKRRMKLAGAKVFSKPFSLCTNMIQSETVPRHFCKQGSSGISEGFFLVLLMTGTHEG